MHIEGVSAVCSRQCRGGQSVCPAPSLPHGGNALLFHGVTPVCVCAGYNKSPCTEIAFCARADQSNNLWCHLACCAINCTAALRRTNIPLPCNGGFRQRILSPAFPRALGEPFIHSAYHPVPSIGGSLCVRLWFYFRFIGLKYL